MSVIFVARESEAPTFAAEEEDDEVPGEQWHIRYSQKVWNSWRLFTISGLNYYELRDLPVNLFDFFKTFEYICPTFQCLSAAQLSVL